MGAARGREEEGGGGGGETVRLFQQFERRGPGPVVLCVLEKSAPGIWNGSEVLVVQSSLLLGAGGGQSCQHCTTTTPTKVSHHERNTAISLVLAVHIYICANTLKSTF